MKCNLTSAIVKVSESSFLLIDRYKVPSQYLDPFFRAKSLRADGVSSRFVVFVLLVKWSTSFPYLFSTVFAYFPCSKVQNCHNHFKVQWLKSKIHSQVFIINDLADLTVLTHPHHMTVLESACENIP